MTDPVAFELGPIDIYWHALLIVTGILVAALISMQAARRWGQDPTWVWEALPWIVGLGLVGARVYHALAIPPSLGVGRWFYLRQPGRILSTWDGGLDAYGALLGGTVGILIAARRARRNPWRWLDIAAPGAALGQAIARWGNWINQELYGLPTNAPWGISIQLKHRLPGYEAYERFQPLFAYESIWNLLVCLILLALIWRHRDRLVPGLVAGIYFVSYATIRFALEFIRLDRPTLAGLPVAQIVSLSLILIWAGLLWWKLKAHREPKRAEPG
jgi:phosphatidylglycerol:prolipoprotein diacylglycerol transferase